MMTILLLLFHALAVQAARPNDLSNLGNHPDIKAHLRGLGEHFSLRLSEDNLPYQDRDSISEPVCPHKIFSCSTVYFYQRYKMIRVDNITFSAISNIEASLITPYDPHDERYKFPAKISTTVSRAVTSSTTKGWKVSLKLGGGLSGDPTQSFASGGADLSGEYSEQYTSTTTTTRSVGVEAPCEAGKLCTIQTLTYLAHLEGRCRVEPIINCGGEEDACHKFETKTVNLHPDLQKGPPLKISKWRDGPCRQWTDYSRRHCRRNRYLEVKCKVSTPVLNRIEEPYTSTVITKKDLPSFDSTGERRWEQVQFAT
ncbi:hypothetical protein L249_6132 [Ophiocordyceps polyrhachis-furcata BCC 54312]|uniref:Uncharacterized protein n=1 Tax=Ophiocordyceps polyrhachis-furcata BCC 54312 TaxID=1330021 RepID=A0A367LIP0_9HYPO|nr:hypothetical protein L249_6132 [Ophiocordyceps polyrhachis-furcata BCC 54312]